LLSRISIDSTYAVGKALSGVGRYSVELVRAMRDLAPEVQWKQYYRPHRFLRAPWPKHLLLDSTPRSCQLFHGLNQRLPKRSQIPCVATFHDLFVLSAEYSSPEFRQRFAAQANHAAENSQLVIAVSNFTATQIQEFLKYPADRIRVVPHGIHLPSSVLPIAARKPIVLSVGALQVRKNTLRLLAAFRALPSPWELWLAGSMGFGADEIRRQAESQERVRLLGYVSEARLAELYAEARIFAFPSLDEGFGIPVLEAMSHGLPVLTSNRSSLPEVAGGAALLVDPLQIEDIAAGLRELSDADRSEKYAARGLERAREFPWQNAARKTLEVYREILG
jgi:glycosyltransferase involved in cell wall biosynthesis